MSRDTPIDKQGRSTEVSTGESRSSQHGGERRVVTALCYDLIGSTNLFNLMDIEDYQDMIAAFQQAARQAITAHSGVVRVEAGDGGVALFPIELGPRDAASAAIRAGLGIVKACQRLARDLVRDDLQVRVGVATSVALIRDTQLQNWIHEPVTGAALALATRLEAAAEPDSVLVSEETRNLAGRSQAFVPEGARMLKGFSAPENVWRAIGHKRELDRFHAFGRLDGTFVGRIAELERIEKAWKAAVEGKGKVVVITGEAGIGKSRLLRQARHMIHAQPVRSLFFQCLPGGFRSTLHPVLNSFPQRHSDSTDGGRLTVAAVAAQFARHGIRDREVISIFSHLLGADGRNEALSDSSPKAIQKRARQALSKALSVMCEQTPLMIAVEDIHWIDPTSEHLLREAARLVPALPALLIVTSRRDPYAGMFDEDEPEHILLGPLDHDETRLAITTRWPSHRQEALPQLLEVSGRISGGVPLFIEEICQWASEAATDDAMSVPSNPSRNHVSVFEGILNSRLEHLGSARDVARAGAVAGDRFTVSLLRPLLPDTSRKSLLHAAETLCETGFLTRVRAQGGIAYGFRHALIQETIYNGLLKTQRQLLHRRLFMATNNNRAIAGWLDTGALAEHAEAAGLPEHAVSLFMKAGKEHASRSAMVEARHHLERALALCETKPEAASDALHLSVLMALGPLLTATVGPNSAPARTLYEKGVEIARRQPKEDQPKWFPLYWGWWQTGQNFMEMHGRARKVQAMLSGVADREIELQVNHSIWAIEFNVGRQREAQKAIRAGLALYDDEAAKTSRNVFGGHDAKVCGLGQLALSLWLTGQTEESSKALVDMVAFVDRIGHMPSKSHSLDTEAVSAFYRNDHARLIEISGRMADFAKKHELQSLSALAMLFRGWAVAHVESLSRGHESFRAGLALLRELGAVADLPIYLYMHATMLGRARKYQTAIEVVTDAIGEAKATGHGYWLAELHRRRALLLSNARAGESALLPDLRTAIAIAQEQGAVALLHRSQRSAKELGFAGEL
ncbi:putative ATPase/class 3 adenylate cyclase [Rhizobium leguminosarum]|uniref:ATPase/class 3 adenylate cyclase n=1 Tax=Rhizobium leguminosarum TaxID=384 RepID=A0AAE2MNB9_RHILE|nr:MULTISPECIES: AAA family ATPase [Rhizobium]MBB4292250.1 putative ATPase/class 3 adenylate cyclase [Rhizobium leguminosarum]MBB4299799.1 putative ATPase/class 3 adenylate cyclase [Rhizobium leguminosarum]MBB4309812.1 putative ATPase/class 3 adenylate cyclase [Rhizobium leguminosarum]MBB4419448.1 putative ATPase/class 3 adenylate cyclase [Rhizobium leguminosarum]MBB4434251.1 putative ATPase/class 3 adenylate cyclase [Rhizobium esperanzae]